MKPSPCKVIESATFYFWSISNPDRFGQGQLRSLKIRRAKNLENGADMKQHHPGQQTKTNPVGLATDYTHLPWITRKMRIGTGPANSKAEPKLFS